MRSFIGAYKALSKCIPQYSGLLGPLEDSVAGKDSKHRVVWNDDLQKTFKDAQQHSKSRKILTIPVPNDQLVIASDGSKSPIAVDATLYVKRGGKLLVGDSLVQNCQTPSYFGSSAKLKHWVSS